jgi:hypothetical protein
VYLCYHGDKVVPQTIIEWTPFERVITRDRVPVPVPNTYLLAEYRLEPTASGTILSHSYALMDRPWLGQLLCRLTLPSMHAQGQKDLEAFRDRIEADFAARPRLQPVQADGEGDGDGEPPSLQGPLL